MKEIFIRFQVPDPDPSRENAAFFAESKITGPHFDLLNRLSPALAGNVDDLGLEIIDCYCHDPAPSQLVNCIVVCDQENVDVVESIILKTVADDDHGLLEMSLAIYDEDDEDAVTEYNLQPIRKGEFFAREVVLVPPALEGCK